MSLLKMLQEGYRMEKPNNTACSQKTSVIKNRTIIWLQQYLLLSLQSLTVWFYILSLHRYESVMLQCWDSSPDQRPTFSNLVPTIENVLTSMANYIDFNQFTLEIEEQKG